MPKKEQRDYPGADYYLLEHGQDLVDQFVQDQADFVAFDPTMADPFDADAQAAITAAVDYVDDETISAQIEQEGNTVETEMQNCRNTYDDVIYFADKAFPKNQAVMREFGQGERYRKASNAQGRMYEFMDQLHKTADKYSAELGIKGFSALRIAAIATQRDAFGNANRAQNMAIGGRPVLTQGRVKALNKVWSFVSQIVKAAKRVYRNNPAKLGQYVYNPPVVTAGGNEIQQQAVPGGETVVVVELTYSATRTLIFRNPGSVVLEYGLSVDGVTFVGSTFGVNPGITLPKESSELHTEGNFILAKNDTTQDGLAEVEYEV